MAESPDNTEQNKHLVPDEIALYEAMAENLRQEGAKNKDVMQRNILFGVAAGLEVAACVLRDKSTDPNAASAKGEKPEATGVTSAMANAEDQTPALLLAKYRPTRIDYLLEAAPGSLSRKRPPKLMVSRVLKGQGKKKAK